MIFLFEELNNSTNVMFTSSDREPFENVKAINEVYNTKIRKSNVKIYIDFNIGDKNVQK